MVCFTLFCRWEWILLGQRQAPVSHHDRVPAQHWPPHAVRAVEPWECTPAQPSPAEPSAHQQYVLGSCWGKKSAWSPAGGWPCLPSQPQGGGKWWETHEWQEGQSFTASYTCASCPSHPLGSVQGLVTFPSWNSHSLLDLGLSVFNWYFHGLDWKEKYS